MKTLDRRGFLTTAGGAAIGALAAGGGVVLGADGTAGSPSRGPVAFDGPHQAGIATPAQDRLHFAAFDLAPDVRAADLRGMLDDWTAAASRMTAGLPAQAPASTAAAPPTDTGEADDLPASRLTITFGFGSSLFEPRGRLGVGAQRPRLLAPLPALPGDELDPASSASRRALRTRRSPSTPCATWRGSGAGSWSRAGRSSASAGRRAPRSASRRRAT
jgi:deferrochelatase/peroxidase EfeB